MPLHTDTIFALSSGRPPAAIAVIRISGLRAGVALAALAGSLPQPRQAKLATLREPATGDILDEALVLWFPAPRSETGEDTAELQLHGGRAVVSAVLAALGGIDGLRPAEAGEFTRRAFENGRLDLTAVEGLADLIGAETQVQRRQAYRQLKGLLGDRAERWRARLIQALALVEARIDFSDEADVPEDLMTPALSIVRELHAEMTQALAGAARGERLRDGFVVAIAGPPNAGKSTLLNRLAQREAAIVSPIPGTTRDPIEVHLDLGGYPVTLIDTAGIRESDDPVEQEGVRRSRQRAHEADLVLWVVDGSLGEAVLPVERMLVRHGLGGDALAGDARLASLAQSEPGDDDRATVWRIENKADAGRIKAGKNEDEPNISFILQLSARSGLGVDDLIRRLGEAVAAFFGVGEASIITRARHRHVLMGAKEALETALQGPSVIAEELIAEELRRGTQALGRLTGRVDVEDILDVIFRDFCIGK